MTLRAKMRRIAGLAETAEDQPDMVPATQHPFPVAEPAHRPIDLAFALDLVARASDEMGSVRAQAEAQRNMHSVLLAARQQVAAAGEIVADLQEKLRESEAKAERLASELERAERRADRAQRAEAQLAELQLAIHHGLSDGLLSARSPGRPKPISVRSSYSSHVNPDGSVGGRKQ